MWTDECEGVCQELNHRLTSAPVLAIPYGINGFVVYTDASHRALGRFIMQHSKVGSLWSRQLKEHEKKYLMQDLELVAVILALNIWQHYLNGEKFGVYTDHKSLKYLLSHKALNLRQHRWAEYRKDYDVTYIITRGKQMS